LPDNITLTDAFLNAINQAYHDFDKDVKQAENILELSSKELFIANKELEKNVASKSAEAEALSKRLSRIVNNVQEVIFQTDLNGCWSFLNSAWERITGYNVEESIGTSFTSMVYPADKEKSVGHLSDLINGDETSRRYNLRYITKSGEVRWTEAIVSLDLDSDGRLLGASGTLTDINARYVAEEKLLQSSENLNQAQALTKLGSFEHPLHSDGVSYWSPQMYELLQCDTSFEPNLAYLVGSFDEGSRTLLNKAIDKLKDGDTEISLELRMKDGESYTMLRAEKHVGRVNKGYVVSGTLMDITERKSFERELISAKLLAERALAAKSEFLSNMSHEIRTPMNAIVGLTEIVLNEKDLNPQTRRNLELIDYSADNLLVIINDILDYSKIEANKVVLERITFDLKGMLSKLLETWRLKADHNQVGLILNWDKEIPSHMVGDPYRLNQILLNLVSNALKFTGQGSVTLKLSLTEKKLDEYNILFEVMDTGMGISQDKLESIFESFTQAYTDTTRNFGGTGLGLAISKRLVELQGGRIHVSSVVGEGSNFSFNIPLYTSTGAAEVELDPRSDLSEGLHGINILVAEDNKINQLLIKQVCKNWNASIEIADDGEIAVLKSNNKDFDVILMDLQMPNMNGFEAVQAIRLDEENRNNKIPILALTADAMPETKSYVQRNGFNGYVTKPFKSYELLREITRCIEAVTQ
jgi:PAS domain S-box-containing protein